MGFVMSLRHNVILLLAGACALAVLGPSLLHHRSGALGSIVTAAPPLVIEDESSADNNSALTPVRVEATGALDRLKSAPRR